MGQIPRSIERISSFFAYYYYSILRRALLLTSLNLYLAILLFLLVRLKKLSIS